VLTARDIGMVALGYGKYVRATDIVALIPIEDDDRGHGRRTYVHVDGLDAPIVASRSAGAILADMERAAGVPSAHRAGASREDAASSATADGRLRGARRWRRRGATAAAAA
jgi:hypothetical protein